MEWMLVAYISLGEERKRIQNTKLIKFGGVTWLTFNI